MESPILPNLILKTSQQQMNPAALRTSFYQPAAQLPGSTGEVHSSATLACIHQTYLGVHKTNGCLLPHIFFKPLDRSPVESQDGIMAVWKQTRVKTCELGFE